MELDEGVRRRFLALDTPLVADVLDELGLVDQGLDAAFGPFPRDAARLAGWAFTLEGETVAYPLEGGDPAKMEACARVGPGSVSVWAGGGEGTCVFGELIALAMARRGCAGALVDGGVRDVRALGRHGFPVYARFRSPVQSIGRWRVTGHGGRVRLPGATVARVEVAPGDLILADDDGGALVVPRAAVADVLARAEALAAQEVEVRRVLEGGLSLAEALRRFGHV